ncbi:unnamed protein product [Dicrocoelium dendriticum]|nr:unnamed protein product [Dicrocoelium dendriticum]
MSDCSYKVIYFNVRGRAEPIRLVLHAAGIPFEDERMEYSDWLARKASIPGGRLPVLLISKPGDAKPKYYQESLAIAQFLARRFQLMGDTDEENYLIDRIIGQCCDFDKELYDAFHVSEDKRKQAIEDAFKGPIQKILDLLSQSLAESDGQFVAGNKLTLGDLYLLATLDHVLKHDEALLKEKYPKLLDYREKVINSNVNLAAYIKSRPDTEV